MITNLTLPLWYWFIKALKRLLNNLLNKTKQNKTFTSESGEQSHFLCRYFNTLHWSAFFFLPGFTTYKFSSVSVLYFGWLHIFFCSFPPLLPPLLPTDEYYPTLTSLTHPDVFPGTMKSGIPCPIHWQFVQNKNKSQTLEFHMEG